MGDHTQLSPVQEGHIWRVRIVWPNGKLNYVGKFTTEKDAIAWIDAHAWLTKPVAEKALDRGAEDEER